MFSNCLKSGNFPTLAAVIKSTLYYNSQIILYFVLYRAHGLKLIHFRRTFLHDFMTF